MYGSQIGSYFVKKKCIFATTEYLLLYSAFSFQYIFLPFNQTFHNNIYVTKEKPERKLDLFAEVYRIFEN